MSAGRRCFVVMPFRGDLNYFYLYLQQYLKEHHQLEARRGDTDVLTKGLMEKIEGEIQDADLVIGEITESNANVFFELGIAWAKRKPIIYLTQGDPEKAPVDLRQFEFIKYDLASHAALLSKLDNAVQNIVGGNHQELYKSALKLLDEFNTATGSRHAAAPYDEFHARVMRGEPTEGTQDYGLNREFLLPKVIANATEIGVIRKIEKWLPEPRVALPGKRRSTTSSRKRRG